MFADRISLTMPETLLVAAAGIIVVILELALLTVLILGLSKIMRSIESKLGKSGSPEATIAPAATPVAAPAPAPAAAVPAMAGIQLIDVDEPTAAVIMAIVSNESGIPLEKLSFKSIRATTALVDVDEPTAAAIMAIVSKESGIPLERLSFKSIKKVEE